MKISRFICPSGGRKFGNVYGYIKANFFERRAIDKMILNGRTNIRRHPLGSEFDCHYIITRKGR